MRWPGHVLRMKKERIPSENKRKMPKRKIKSRWEKKYVIEKEGNIWEVWKETD
jgi:hypothetical protein